LPSSDRELVEGYLAWKWGLQANLPVDHPYRNAPPTTGDAGVPGDPIAMTLDRSIVDSDGARLNIGVDAADDVSWSVTSSSPWVRVVDPDGIGADGVDVLIDPHGGHDYRTAEIELVSTGGSASRVLVLQLGVCEGSSLDCNANGISDACEVGWGMTPDENANGIPDGCEIGRIVDVPEEYPTISAALDHAVDGWTIRLAPGTYADRLDIRDHHVRVEGVGHPSETVIDASAHQDGVVRISARAATTDLGPVRLSRMTLRGGSGSLDSAGVRIGGGVSLEGGYATIDECVVEQNHADLGGGLAIRNGGLAVIDSTIRDNAAQEFGGGLEMIDATVVLVGSVVTGNDAGILAGGVRNRSSLESTLALFDSAICGNRPDNLVGPWIDLGASEVCACAADINLDGIVDGADLALVASAWGETVSPADVNGDDVVDGADLAEILAGWGICDS